MLRTGCQRIAGIDEVGRGALAGPVTVGVVVVTERIGRVPQGLRDSKLLTPAARSRLIVPIRRWAVECAVGHASATEIDRIGIMAALRSAVRRAFAQLSGPVDAVLLDGNHNYLLPPPLPVDEPALFEPDGVGPAAAATAGPVGAGGAADGAAGALGAVGALGAPGAAEPVVTVPDRSDDGPALDPMPPVHLKIKADLTCAAVAGASVLAKTARDGLLTDLHRYFPGFGFDVNKGYATEEHRAALRDAGPSVVHRRSWQLVRHDEAADGARHRRQLQRPTAQQAQEGRAS